jgi:hypothetical protein
MGSLTNICIPILQVQALLENGRHLEPGRLLVLKLEILAPKRSKEVLLEHKINLV